MKDIKNNIEFSYKRTERKLPITFTTIIQNRCVRFLFSFHTISCEQNAAAFDPHVIISLCESRMLLIVDQANSSFDFSRRIPPNLGRYHE